MNHQLVFLTTVLFVQKNHPELLQQLNLQLVILFYYLRNFWRSYWRTINFFPLYCVLLQNNSVGINVEWTENHFSMTVYSFHQDLKLFEDLKCWLHNRLFLLGINPFRQTALTHDSNFCGSFNGNLKKYTRTCLSTIFAAMWKASRRHY